MRSLQISTLLIALLLLSVMTAGFCSEPGWLYKYPLSPNHYTGIGCANKHSYPVKYREIAREKALTQISKEISIRLQSKTIWKKAQSKSYEREKYSQSIVSSTRSALWGYELVDIYETSSDFWVYYKLNKTKYHKLISEDQAARENFLSQQFFKVRNYLTEGDFQKALEIFKESGLMFNDLYKDCSTIPLKNIEIYGKYYSLRDSIQILLDRTEILFNHNTIVLNVDSILIQGAPFYLDCSLRDRNTGTNWKGPFTLSLELSESEKCLITTNRRGQLDLRTIISSCSIKSGIWKFSWSPELKPGFNSLKRKIISGNIMVSIKPVRVHWNIINRSETNNIDEVIRKAIESSVSIYIDVVKDKELADKIIKIDVHNIVQDSLYGMNFTSIKGVLNTSTENGNRIISAKGGHSDKFESMRAAAQDFVDEVMELLLSPSSL